MSTYMQGPWRVEIGDEGRPSGVCQNDENGWNVCTFPHTAWRAGGNRPGRREEILANARLIAAAPELLEAAKAAESELTACHKLLSEVCAADVARSQNEIEALRKAIAKAEGKD